MDRDLAVRLTATEDSDEVRVAQVERILTSFVQNLVICSVCGGTGTFTVTADTPLLVRPEDPKDPVVRATAVAGQQLNCPPCAGTGRDRAFSTWHCFNNESEKHCRDARENGKDATRALHERCRVYALLPLDKQGSGPND